MVSRSAVTYLLAVAAIGSTAVFAQGAKRFEGTVVVDNKQPVVVSDLQMDFRPTFGLYDASLYGKRQAIPLDNGIKASFDRITEARFSCRVDYEETARGKVARAAVVQVMLRTTTGQKVDGTLAGPPGAVFLVGTTELGPFELRLNPFESRETVVAFRR